MPVTTSVWAAYWTETFPPSASMTSPSPVKSPSDRSESHCSNVSIGPPHHELVDRAPDQLVARVPEQRDHRGVDLGDAPLAVEQDHGVPRPSEGGPEQPRQGIRGRHDGSLRALGARWEEIRHREPAGVAA